MNRDGKEVGIDLLGELGKLKVIKIVIVDEVVFGIRRVDVIFVFGS